MATEAANAEAQIDDMADPDTRGLPAAERVVSPATLEEAAVVFRYASEHRLTCLIWGGGSHQDIGYEVEPNVVVTTRRLNRVVVHEVDDLTVVVEGGTPVDELRNLLSENDQTAILPDVPSGATVGGIIATALSGWPRYRYGPTRDRVLETQLVTGDGRVVRAGGRVVKNVTGFDIPRLVTGSVGSLGLVGTVCLKLWPRPGFVAAVKVADSATAMRMAYRPLAVVETAAEVTVYLGGTEPDVAAQAENLGGDVTVDPEWPERLAEPFTFSMRVPPGRVTDAVDLLRDNGVESFQASHGVGEIMLGTRSPDVDGLVVLRRWAEEEGGALVGRQGRIEGFDPWGTAPQSLELQRRVKAAFDPMGVANPGRLPGRL